MSNSSMPGVVRDIVGNSGCDCTTLSLPQTVVNTLEGPALKRVNTILLEYARDVTLLQSKAYDAVLAAFRDS